MTHPMNGWKHNGHFWDDCQSCGRMVVCGKCGNNCCNGGYGEIIGPDKVGDEVVMIACDACPSAYEMQDEGEVAPALRQGQS